MYVIIAKKKLGGGNSQIWIFSPFQIGEMMIQFDGPHIFGQMGWVETTTGKHVRFGILTILVPRLMENFWNPEFGVSRKKILQKRVFFR